VIDLEAIDPARVELPPWYRADPGRARDLAMVFVSASAHEPLRATQITNRRWAVSALGAAAAAMLTARDTVYCCLPLHHPSGALVATGSALVSGARLALARRFDPALLWDEVRRYGATVVYYAGELCRRLVDAPPHRGEREHPVRLFAGSGLRRGVWRALVDRFGPVGVLELYASTEAAAVLANARGQKVGSVGRPLPGSPELMLAAWDFAARRFERTGAGHVVPAPLGEPGVLLARLPARGPAPAHLPAERLLRGALAPGDLWFVTGDLLEVDPDGDHFFVGRLAHIIDTRRGPVAPARIEDALYQVAGVALCVALAHDDPDHPGAQVPVAAVELRPGAALDLAALAAAVAALPEAARPHRVRVVAAIPLSDGYRAIRPAALEVGDGPAVYEWDALGRSFRATAPAP
jgi:putative long chain acyl-CoA synthase